MEEPEAITPLALAHGSGAPFAILTQHFWLSPACSAITAYLQPDNKVQVQLPQTNRTSIFIDGGN